jgi:hypothetical protein
MMGLDGLPFICAGFLELQAGHGQPDSLRRSWHFFFIFGLVDAASSLHLGRETG